MKRQRSCEKRYVLVFNASTIIVLRELGRVDLIEFAKKHGVITKEEALNLLERIPSTSLYVTREVLEEARNRIMLQ